MRTLKLPLLETLDTQHGEQNEDGVTDISEGSRDKKDEDIPEELTPLTVFV